MIVGSITLILLYRSILRHMLPMVHSYCTIRNTIPVDSLSIPSHFACLLMDYMCLEDMVMDMVRLSDNMTLSNMYDSMRMRFDQSRYMIHLDNRTRPYSYHSDSLSLIRCSMTPNRMCYNHQS